MLHAFWLRAYGASFAEAVEEGIVIMGVQGPDGTVPAIGNTQQEVHGPENGANANFQGRRASLGQTRGGQTHSISTGGASSAGVGEELKGEKGNRILGGRDPDRGFDMRVSHLGTIMELKEKNDSDRRDFEDVPMEEAVPQYMREHIREYLRGGEASESECQHQRGGVRGWVSDKLSLLRGDVAKFLEFLVSGMRSIL